MSSTRAGQFGVGLRAYGAFAPKTPAGASAHNPGIVTRLGQGGFGVRAYGVFAPKTPATGGGAHNPGIVTRLGQAGFGVRAYRTFTAKTPAGGEAETHRFSGDSRRRNLSGRRSSRR